MALGDISTSGIRGATIGAWYCGTFTRCSTCKARGRRVMTREVVPRQYCWIHRCYMWRCEGGEMFENDMNIHRQYIVPHRKRNERLSSQKFSMRILVRQGGIRWSILSLDPMLVSKTTSLLIDAHFHKSGGEKKPCGKILISLFLRWSESETTYDLNVSAVEPLTWIKACCHNRNCFELRCTLWHEQD